MRAGGFSLISAIGILFLSACSGSKTEAVGSVSHLLGSASAESQFVAAQVQSINEPLNAVPQYAMTSEDLAILKSEGLLEAGDDEALAQLVKK